MLLLRVIDTGVLATFNQLGLLAVPSDAQGQKRRLRHHARLNARRLLESEAAKGVTARRIVLDLVVMGSYGGRVWQFAKNLRWCT